jgi:hypothetical protein
VLKNYDGRRNKLFWSRAGRGCRCNAQRALPGVLQHPALTIYDSMGKVIFSNTGWGNSPVLLKAAASAYANPVLQPDSNDSEVLLTLPPGGYTAQVAGADGGTGVALCAIYQLP